MFFGLSSNVSTWGQFHKNMLMNLIRNICSDITLLKLRPHLPGTNELDGFVSPKPRRTPPPIVVFQMQCDRDMNFTGNTMSIAIIEFLGDFQPGG